MSFTLTAIEWISILFFGIVSILLLINILTINKLREDRLALTDNEALLTTLLGKIQNHFSKIDTNIATVAKEEKQLHELVELHQKDENLVLNALELNQSLFLERMDKIVNIQQALSDKISLLETPKGSIPPEMIRLAASFMSTQKRELSLMKNRIENLVALTSPLQDIHEEMQIISQKAAWSKESISSSTVIKEQQMTEIQKSLQVLAQAIVPKSIQTLDIQEDIDSATQNIQALTKHIDIAKRNIQSVVEQSIDLNPVYKSVHELIEQIKNIFDDYHLAKGEIQSLLQMLQRHENKDLVELKKEVEIFLSDIKEEIKTSVEMLKKEYHLGQNQVTGTVKTLSDRSQANSAYATKTRDDNQ